MVWLHRSNTLAYIGVGQGEILQNISPECFHKFSNSLNKNYKKPKIVRNPPSSILNRISTIKAIKSIKCPHIFTWLFISIRSVNRILLKLNHLHVNWTLSPTCRETVSKITIRTPWKCHLMQINWSRPRDGSAYD